MIDTTKRIDNDLCFLLHFSETMLDNILGKIMESLNKIISSTSFDSGCFKFAAKGASISDFIYVYVVIPFFLWFENFQTSLTSIFLCLRFMTIF